MQNVKVLAVDQSAERQDEDSIKPGKTVTLAVSAQGAERLTLAADVGSLNLVLRGVGDDVMVEKKWPTISDARLTSMGDEIFEELERVKKESGTNSNTVRIYNGNSLDAVKTR